MRPERRRCIEDSLATEITWTVMAMELLVSLIVGEGNAAQSVKMPTAGEYSWR